MMRLLILICLVAAGARAQTSSACVGDKCRVDNINQDSVETPNQPTPISYRQSSIYLDCNFQTQRLGITVVAPPQVTTHIIEEPDQVRSTCERGSKFGQMDRSLLPPKNTAFFDFDETTPGINLNGTFEFARDVCIIQENPHESGQAGSQRSYLLLTAACCLEPECIPHPLIIPIINITVGICKTDEWQMTSDAGEPDRTSGVTITPIGTPTDDLDGPIQYVKRCMVVSQKPGVGEVAFVENGKLQYQSVLKSKGIFDANNRRFEFDFNTFVPSSMDVPIDWYSNHNETCPLISCHFGYCTRDGSSASPCSDFYENAFNVAGEVWRVQKA